MCTQTWGRPLTIERVARKVIYGKGNDSYARFEKLLTIDDNVPRYYTDIVREAMGHITY